MRASPKSRRLVAPNPADVERELQEFSYTVSHDLAASFRHVSEFSRLLLSELGEGLTPRQRDHAEHIRQANARCQTMMQELLVYSRLQQKTLEPVWQDATRVMQLALMQLARQPQSAAANISIEPLGEVYADASLLALAFQHLLGNAIKFARPDAPQKIKISSTHLKATWRLRIADNGVGIEPAHRDKAFGMFRTLNGENAYPGVGAGLAICRRIARRHGGDVRFLDCQTGACVELALPDTADRPSRAITPKKAA